MSTRTIVGVSAASTAAVVGALLWLGLVGPSEPPRDAHRSTLDREAQAQLERTAQTQGQQLREAERQAQDRRSR